MGQSFTDNGEYIGWSNLFDFSNYSTLAASKTLPIPKGYELVAGDYKYNIDFELKAINDAHNAKNKVAEIKAYAKLINKIDAQHGIYNHNWNGDNATKLIAQRILDRVQKHELYKAPEYLKEAMYKNVASANIFNNVHDIRNRDQAYSPITMNDMQRSAAQSPKGEKSRALNMINPFTKYIMQNENLVGKDVIGIAANGEKDWFNLTYYYHTLLRTGDDSDCFFIKMEHQFNRIKGRSKGKPVSTIIRHIPDLWNADGVLDKQKLNSQVARRLKELFYNDDKLKFENADIEDKYVDQLISQLLSAATDNAKELILAKINAGTNLAKYHLHLIMMGFSLDDIMSFMTSPVVELIDKYSKSDLYDKRISTVNSALSLLEGKLKLSQFLVSPKVNLSYEEREVAQEIAAEQAEFETELAMQAAQEGIPYNNQSNEYAWVIKELVNDESKNMYTISGCKSLENWIQEYIIAHTSDEQKTDSEITKLLRKYKLPTTDNFNTNQFFNFVNQLIDDINNTIRNYNIHNPNVNYTLNDYAEDLSEFKILSDQANETSTLASTWLKLNQGVPQTDVDLIKLMKKMNDSVSSRENKFYIKRPADSKRKKSLLILADEDNATKEDEKEVKSKTTLIDQLIELSNYINEIRTDPQKFRNTRFGLESFITDKLSSNRGNIYKTIVKIKENNPMLDYQEIISILIDAIDVDLFGNFDIYKYLSNETVALKSHTRKDNSSTRYPYYKDNTGALIKGDSVPYREIAARYYNLIKSSWNILDIMRRIPHYEKNLDLLNYTLQNRQIFAAKARVVDTLMSLGELSQRTLTDKEYKQVINYTDRILNTSFFFSIQDGISLNQVIPEGGKSPLLFNSEYKLEESNMLYLNSLNGIDSLKHFVENEFLNWLKETYKDNPLVKDLDLRSNHGKSILRTRLNLDQINTSLTNQQTFNSYLVGIKQLAQEQFTDKYTVADILALYNLAVNNNKLGGKYLTAIFRDSVLPGSILYKYYQYLGKVDYDSIMNTVHPTKKDLLIALAPVVYSEKLVNFRTEPYVKVANPVRGYDLYYKRNDKSDTKYSKIDLARMLSFNRSLSVDESNDRVAEYFSSALNLFPELHRRMVDDNIFTSVNDDDITKLITRINDYIETKRIAILKDCN